MKLAQSSRASRLVSVRVRVRVRARLRVQG